MRRVFTVLVGLSLLVAACGEGSVLGASGDGSPGTTAAAPQTPGTEPLPTEPPATQPPATPPPTQPPATQPAGSETTATPSPAPDLAVLQVMARYQGASGAGTFEATVCNRGEAAEPSAQVTITANGTEIAVAAPAMPPMSCVDVFDARADLPAYGVSAAGPVQVSVRAVASLGGEDAGDEVVATVDVPGVTMAAPGGELQDFRNCIGTGQDVRHCVNKVRYHPIGDLGEVMKVAGRYLAIGPEEYGEILSYFVADNALCTPRIEDWMGTAGPTPVSHRLVVTDDYGGAYAEPFYAIYSLGSRSRWDEAAGAVDSWWERRLQGICDNAHELTHLVLGETPMPNWLNEGLATYLQDDGRTGYKKPQPVECRATGWYGSLYEGGQAEVPYQDLMDWDQSVPGIYYYYTAMCFWDYLESEYGVDAIRAILADTVSHRGPAYAGCGVLDQPVRFIRDIVNPILGVDVTPVTRSRWGFGETFTACEG